MEILLVLVVVLVIENSEIEDVKECDNEGDWKKKIANPLRRCAEAIRVARFVFIFPSRPRGAALKDHLSVRRGGVTRPAPACAVLDNPVRQRLLEADVAPRFFRLNPLVPEDFLALGLKFAVERRILQQIVRRR